MPAGEHTGQRQAGQRDHGTGVAQHRVGQLEQRVRARGQALMELGPEPSQRPGSRAGGGFGENGQAKPLLLRFFVSQQESSSKGFARVQAGPPDQPQRLKIKLVLSARDFVTGLLTSLERKNCVTIAEWAGHSS